MIYDCEKQKDLSLIHVSFAGAAGSDWHGFTGLWQVGFILK